MRPSYCWLAALLLATAADAHGQTPTLADAKPADGQPQVLLLDNLQIVEAVAERNGDGFTATVGKDVRRYPASKVLFAGDSHDAVRRYLLARAARPATAEPAAAGELSAAATRVFPARVQPVLMNLCVSCHGKPDHASGFKLVRVPDGYANTDAARDNARSAAAFVKSDDPAGSPLLLKAMAAHGGSRQPPLPSRTHPAYRSLEAWVYAVAGPAGSKTVAATSAPATKPPTLPPATAKADDPFDPEMFNRAKK